MTKTCSKCGETKPVDEFPKNENRCLCCKKEYHKNHYLKNKQLVSQISKIKYLENREQKLLKSKEYRLNNKDKVKIIKAKYYQNNKERIIKNVSDYRSHNIEKVSNGVKKYHTENVDKIRNYIKLYRENKSKTDILFNIKNRVRLRTYHAFTSIGSNKPAKTEKLLGCDWQHLKFYFESKFIDGMSWDNRHLWHIDHIVPLASASTEEEIVKLCHYTNLQPLWAMDNIQKGAKLPL